MAASQDRPEWPKRAVVTAGMPYGNKPLHFGHIGGVFVPADCFARFLRDRIGKDNVRFVSGTDCFGSPINEGYRKLLEAGEFDGTIAEYVQANHDAQKRTLEVYGISLSIFEGSGIGQAGTVHQQLSETFIERLHENGYLSCKSTLQFYDVKAQTFLNGRQVQGYCPVQGCKSDHAYADECDLGHQYAPADLIKPISTISNTVPEMRPVENWYFDLPQFADFLRMHVAELEADPEIRAVVSSTIKEFLAPPVVYVKNEAYEAYREIAGDLPTHSYRPAEEGKQSFEIEFATIDDRDEARTLLAKAGIRFRVGKALTPFRITGNIEWGVKAPVLEGKDGLTVWCWPESLWAPISFTMAENDRQGLPRGSWRDFWCSDDAEIYQFIGQDNLYFYGVAQPALFEALGPKGLAGVGEAAPGEVGACEVDPNESSAPLRQTRLIANHHLLFGNKKASSSGEVKPPTADELLEHYTPEQLRAHFLALGLDQKSVGFKPKPYDPDEKKRTDPRVADPVLKEGALLSNVFNRLARSCFYEAQRNFEGYMPLGAVSAKVREKAHEALNAYEHTMHRVELHTVMSIVDEFIRWSNKYWTDGISAVQKAADALGEGAGEAAAAQAVDREAVEAERRQLLVDCFYLLRVATLLMHPIVPWGTEKICSYLALDPDEFFSWNYDFESNAELCSADELAEGRHCLRELPPRTDFFEKLPSQVR